jgi:hypothetical protein
MDGLVVKNTTIYDLKGRMYILKISEKTCFGHSWPSLGFVKTLKIVYYINHVTMCWGDLDIKILSSTLGQVIYIVHSPKCSDKTWWWPWMAKTCCFFRYFKNIHSSFYTIHSCVFWLPTHPFNLPWWNEWWKGAQLVADVWFKPKPS